MMLVKTVKLLTVIKHVIDFQKKCHVTIVLELKITSQHSLINLFNLQIKMQTASIAILFQVLINMSVS